jgi:nucleoside-diphosphate-sugar epimerase
MAASEDRPVVLITGAAGLIGTEVARRLAPAYRIVALDVESPPGSFPREAHFVECDLTSDRATQDALRKARQLVGPRLASVIHLAAYYDFSGEPSALYEELTVGGTRRLLRALHESFQTEQFVFSSSLLVMKPADDDDVLTESSPVRAEWDYPESKLDAEAVIREERGEIPAVILRLAGVYDEGGHSPPICQQIWRIREKKLESFFFPGDPSHGQSFVHLEDAANCIRSVVDRRGELEPHEIFLVGEPDMLSYGELQDRIGDLVHGQEWPTLRIPAPLAKAGAWVKEKTRSGTRSSSSPG